MSCAIDLGIVTISGVQPFQKLFKDERKYDRIAAIVAGKGFNKHLFVSNDIKVMMNWTFQFEPSNWETVLRCRGPAAALRLSLRLSRISQHSFPMRRFK